MGQKGSLAGAVQAANCAGGVVIRAAGAAVVVLAGVDVSAAASPAAVHDVPCCHGSFSQVLAEGRPGISDWHPGQHQTWQLM